VRGTYLLAVHEFRRYVRVPVAVEVEIDADGRRLSSLSQEVSSGGMSLEVQDRIPEARNVNAVFTLPGTRTITIRSAICWRRENAKMFGIRFDPQDANRRVVREWIEKFLDSQPV
jgi:Ni,Fe-hydrogenase III component G